MFVLLRRRERVSRVAWCSDVTCGFSFANDGFDFCIGADMDVVGNCEYIVWERCMYVICEVFELRV